MKSENIQIIVTGVFIFFAVVGVILFSVSSTKKGAVENPRVVIWGLIEKNKFTPIVEEANIGAPGTTNLEYVEKQSEEELEQDLVTALLDKSGIPDGLIIPDRLLMKLQKRLTLISWTAVSERTLKDTYSEAGEIFFAPSGTYAIPFLIDPLVLYWNRDMFNSKLITKTPETWEELTKLVPIFTEKKEDKSIAKNAIALGEYQNIPRAKEIIGAMTLQSGGKIVLQKENKFQEDVLETLTGLEVSPLQTVLTYFTEFADPASPLFSWSRALPDALTMFLGSDSAMYIGFGSEAATLRSKNPNLNLDIAFLPQATGAAKKVTFGNVYGIAIVDASPNKAAMLNTAFVLTNTTFQEKFSDVNKMAPVRRDMLANPPGSGVLDVVWKSALWSKSWLDPDYATTANLFKSMIESVTSGKELVLGAVVQFQKELKEILDEYNK